MKEIEVVPLHLLLVYLIFFIGGCLIAWPLVVFVPWKFLLIGIVATQLVKFVDIEW